MSWQQDYSRITGINWSEYTLLCHSSKENFSQSGHTALKAPADMKAQIEAATGARILDGLARFEDFVDSLRNVDVAVISHGGFHHTGFMAAHKAGVPLIVERVENPNPCQQYDFVDWTICVSQSVARLQPDSSRTSVIYSGIDLGRFRTDRVKIAKKDRLILVQVGYPYDVDPAGMERLVGLLRGAGVPAVGWTVGTDGPSTELHRYWGWRNDVPEILNQADLFIHLAPRDEAFGYMVVEAMACGLIPIVANLEGPGEIVQNGTSGFHYTRGNLEEAGSVVAALWRDVASDGPIVPRFIEAARRRARDFDAPVTAAKHEALFLKLWDEKGKIRERRPLQVDPAEGPWHDTFEFLTRGRWSDFFDGVERCLAQGALPLPAADLITWIDLQVQQHPKAMMSLEDSAFARERIVSLHAALQSGDMPAAWFELLKWALLTRQSDFSRRFLRRCLELAGRSGESETWIHRLAATELFSYCTQFNHPDLSRRLASLADDLRGRVFSGRTGLPDLPHSPAITQATTLFPL